MAGRIRQPINKEALEGYLKDHIPNIQLPIEVKQFGFGQSNPTYQLTGSNGSRYVLRKKPPGKLLSKTAHKVEREYRIITALGRTDFPVPKTYCLCNDETVIGTSFYIMEFLDGRIFEDNALRTSTPKECTLLWKAAAYNLAKFHRVDFRKIGLETYGKLAGFYDRQLGTFTQLSLSQSKTVDADTKSPVGDIPHFGELAQFFANKKLQPAERATLIHGDYKLDNMVYHKTEPIVIGVLDWEMSTVGHPLSDLANFLQPFFTVDLHPKYMSADFLPGVKPGLPTAETLLEWYTQVAGWDPRPELAWAVAFSVFRSAVICQGIAARVAKRQATSEQAHNYADAFPSLAVFAWNLMPAFTLYGARGSSNTDRVRLTLAEGGFTDYELVLLNLQQGEQKSEENLKRHPWGKIPAITFPGGFTLYESRAICKYITRKYAFPLLPSASDIEAMALFDVAESTEVLYFAEPAGRIAFERFAKIFIGLPPNETVVSDALQLVENFFEATESLLQHRDYMAGKDFTLVDIYYIPLIQRLFSCGYGDFVLSRKAVSAWWNRCINRPAIQQILAADREAMAAAGK
ncbi:Acyl-CoA dehydrogenase family member-like protein [Paramyrothecium foliicola]|nr:Acyl-CoA dehydrogenase family member-like protein [Paramyrothecium foliicola]